jgi:hypothetical protein
MLIFCRFVFAGYIGKMGRIYPRKMASTVALEVTHSKVKSQKAYNSGFLTILIELTLS